MSKPRTRRLVGTFSTEADPQTGQPLTKIPGKRSRERDEYLQGKEGRGSALDEQPPYQNAGEGAETGADTELATLLEREALTNEQIEERLRKLAGPCLDLLGQLIACGTSGRKLPRNVQAAIGNAQWVIAEARKASKASADAAADKDRAAKLENARKAFSTSGGAALLGELQARTRAERTGNGDGKH